MGHPPPAGNPDWVPAWGNREETTIQLPVGALSALRPVLDFISGVSACDIDQSDGRTSGGDNPFGGVVTISGFIPGCAGCRGAADAVPRAGASRRLGDVDDPRGSVLGERHPVDRHHLPRVVQPAAEADADGYFPYLVDRNIAGAGYRTVYGDVLYPWQTLALAAGLWEIEVISKDAGGTVYPAQILQCSDGSDRADGHDPPR